MTNEQINIAIAEFVNGDNEGPFPNYCNDLNAMHEAEKVLDYEQCEAFVDTITDTTHAAIDYEAPWDFTRIHATAEQRAEAFLRTLGKWEEI